MGDQLWIFILMLFSEFENPPYSLSDLQNGPYIHENYESVFLFLNIYMYDN